LAKRRPIREGFWIALVFIAIVIFSLVADWWKENATLGWIILGILLAVFAFLLYRFASLRGWLGHQAKSVAEKAIRGDVASAREPVPQDKRNEVLKQARYRCENERCNQKVRPHIHHIDMNNSNNHLSNLIALCPNCHQRAHDGKFTESQLLNWVRRDFKRLKSRRATV